MKQKLSNIYVIIFCVLMIVISFFLGRSKRQMEEVKNLPFTNTQIEQINDGTYYGKTYTTFMRLQINVTVKDHKLTDIEFIENEGSKGSKAEEMAKRMIAENKVAVELIDKDELGSAVLISCVDSALESALKTQNMINESETSEKDSGAGTDLDSDDTSETAASLGTDL